MAKSLAISFLCLVCAAAVADSSLFLTDAARAFRTAKRMRKPVMVSFDAIWCPPCNQLREDVFESKAFLQRAKKFVLLELDADARSSWKLKSKYKVGGYPTVVFTNSHGDEIYRVVGYRTPAELGRILDLVLGAKGKDLRASCKSRTADDLWRCLVMCSERKESCAEAALKKLEKILPPGSAREAQARTYAVERSPTEDLKRDGYEKLLGDAKLGPMAVVWVQDYIHLSETEGFSIKKPLLERFLQSFPQLAVDAQLEEAGLTSSDALEAKALALAKLGRRDEATRAWRELADKLAALSAKTGGRARGVTLERLEALVGAGDLPAALTLANQYREKYPDEFTFHFWAANILERQRRYHDAIPVAKQAFEKSYDDNRVRVATLLVRLYATIPDRMAAKKIHDEVTAQIKPEASLDVRIKDYLKKLEAAWAAFPR